MDIKYIYNYQGQQESVVIPMGLWRFIQGYLPNLFKKEAEKDNVLENKKFDPTAYFGMTAYLNLDIEEELKNMRSEWNRTF